MISHIVGPKILGAYRSAKGGGCRCWRSRARSRCSVLLEVTMAALGQLLDERIGSAMLADGFGGIIERLADIDAMSLRGQAKFAKREYKLLV